MASATTLKVRFVRCPKCRLVLPEVADVPVYKCGGCDTILVAKNRQTNGQNIISSKETEASETNKVVHESKQGESISSNHKTPLASNGELHLDKENGDPQDTSGECNEEKPDHNLSNEAKQNGGYQSDRSSSSDCSLEHDGIKSVAEELDGYSEKKQNGSVDCASKQLRANLSEDEDEDGSEQDKVLSKNAQRPGVSNEGYSSAGLVHNDGEEQSSLVAGNSATERDGLSSEIRGVKQVDPNDDSNIRSLSADGRISPPGTDLSVPANGPKTESISSDNLTSPDEQLEQSQKIHHDGISRVTSSDTFYTTDFVGPSPELSGAFEYVSKSTTVRSSHTYEGSISSFDGMDDPLPDQHMDPFGNSYEIPNRFVPGERTRRDKFLLGSMKSSISGVHGQGRNFSPDLSDKKDYTTKHKWHRDKLLEHTMHRNRRRFERAEYPYQIPVPQRASFAGYESGSTSSELHDEFSLRSNFHPLDELENTEKEKMKLLRMVYELQDQLQKSSFFNGRAPSEATWNEKQFPVYYDYEAPEKEGLYASYPEKNMLWSNWSQRNKYSPIPFSADTVTRGRQGDHSCSCYHPKDWRSAPLPPQALYHNRGFCRVHPDHDYYSFNSSWPSTPQRYAKSEFPIQSYELMSDDQRYKDRVVSKYPRGKHGTAKRHLRPAAGGAPLATCNSCSSLLQLPADFLLFKRGLHRLKCGVCSAILKFSLENRIHLVPCEPIVLDPPSSELDDYSNAMDRSSHAHPLLCSNEYRLSCKSCSTDGEPSSQVPSRDERKTFVLEPSRNKHKSPMELYESARATNSMPSEMEELELPRRAGSPLHRLMGYSSVSQVFKRPGQADSGTLSYYTGESSKS